MSSPSPRPVTVLDKSATLRGLYASWERVEQLTAGLSEAQWRTPTTLPGWTVHDVVSHVIGVESLLMGVATPEPDIDVAEIEHVHNAIGVMNECWVRYLRPDPGPALLDRLRLVTDGRRKVLADLPDAEWDAVTGTPAGPDSYGRFMRIRTFDTWMHEQDIRDALERPPSDDDLTGPAPQLALDEMAASMGFVVGKLAGAPEGSRVQIELSGPLARTIRVAVAGRAAVVNDFDGDDFDGAEPTSVIRVDGLLFTRLAGGRTTVAEHPGAVDYDGDAEVGQRVVARLSYVI
ncbi:MAG: maleylpyruvate isomerase family mycothiol-dependent enzyme [Mycobacterium sp.]